MQKSINFPLRIKPTVTVLFFSIGIFLTVSILGLQYYFGKRQAINSASSMFKNLATVIDEKIFSFDKNGENLANIVLESESSKVLPKDKVRHPLLGLFTTILNNENYYYSIYTGYDNGDFFEVINLDINPILREKYHTNSDEKWLVVKIFKKDGKRVRVEEFLDRDLVKKREQQKDAKYDPRLRPWYKKASKSTSTERTAPYKYSSTDQMGVTYAKQSQNKHYVVGVDVVLDSLDVFLKKQSFGLDEQVFIYNKKGDIIATNSDSDKENNLLFKAFRKSEKKNIENLLDQNYFIFYSNIKDAKGEYLGVLAPMDTILKPYYKNLYYSFLMTMFIAFLFALPIIYYFSNLITKPILKISKENDLIRKREFDKVSPIETNIVEIQELSTSLVSMSKDIQAYEEAQKKLMDSFIKMLGNTIDVKSNYTGAHNTRVAELAILIAQKASDSKDGIFSDFTLTTEDEEREIEIAAWLHDCGKLVMPEHIVDKATKLETIYNRIHEIRMRFEVLYRDGIIDSLNDIIDGIRTKEDHKEYIDAKLQKLREDFAFISECNLGGEFMSQENIQKLTAIGEQEWTRYFDNTIGLSQAEMQRVGEITAPPAKEKLLDDKPEHIITRENFSEEEYENYGFKIRPPKDLYNLGEIYNLSISRGTLTDEDRFKINEHSIMTIKMLSELPFPDILKNVPEYAGAHHETLIGTGYPRKLTKEDMSLPARILALADIFEALSASDRPYKTPKPLTESIKILSFMVKDKHIDEDIFKLFLASGAYMEYAKKYLNQKQIDDVDINSYLNM